MSRLATPITINLRARLMLAVASIAGVLAFCWPLFVQPGAAMSDAQTAPLILAALLPLVLAVVVAEISGGNLDVKALAMLGVLSAVGAALRPLGAGVGGFETVFFLLVLAGRVFGPGFGFVLGTTTLFSSALLTSGVGPWLPFQMIAAGFVGLGAGLLPSAAHRVEIVMLAVYGAVSAFAYGILMNFSFWPFTLGAQTQLSFVPGASIVDNLQSFALFEVTTSLGWEVGRAVTNVVLICLAGPGLLLVLRRAARRANFISA